eukprot:scaffold7105_cov116-Isochrysis_galbana.AAC.9
MRTRAEPSATLPGPGRIFTTLPLVGAAGTKPHSADGPLIVLSHYTLQNRTKPVVGIPRVASHGASKLSLTTTTPCRHAAPTSPRS